MKTLTWKRTDWGARNFIFLIGQEIIGQLTFNNSWNLNAVYSDTETKLHFSQKKFWGKEVLITKDGKPSGAIEFKLFGVQVLKLPTGERFTLSSNFWGRDVNWKNEKGEAVITYHQSAITAAGKGLINLNESLKLETENLLISSGLFIRQVMLKRVILLLVIIIPALASSRRY
jgi:hypothetical protein